MTHMPERTFRERLEGLVAAKGLNPDNPDHVASVIDSSPAAKRLYEKICIEEGLQCDGAMVDFLEGDDG